MLRVCGAGAPEPVCGAVAVSERLADAPGGGQGSVDPRAPRDEELTFCLQVWRDLGLARACLLRLRRHYPGARVVLVTDGDDDPRWPALCARHDAEYVRGERLFEVARGGAIVQRLLELHLRRPTPWLLRIDTDTRVQRRFRALPSGACVFGTLERRTLAHGELLDPPLVQGGCLGFTLQAVERLHAEGVFLSPRLIDWAATWADTRDARERARGGRVSFDHLVRWGCREAGIEPRAHDEVFSVWRGTPRNPGLRYAVTHPHKPWWQQPRLWASLWLARVRARPREN